MLHLRLLFWNEQQQLRSTPNLLYTTLLLCNQSSRIHNWIYNGMALFGWSSFSFPIVYQSKCNQTIVVSCNEPVHIKISRVLDRMAHQEWKTVSGLFGMVSLTICLANSGVGLVWNCKLGGIVTRCVILWGRRQQDNNLSSSWILSSLCFLCRNGNCTNICSYGWIGDRIPTHPLFCFFTLLNSIVYVHGSRLKVSDWKILFSLIEGESCVCMCVCTHV